MAGILVTDAEALAELRRELGMRRGAYSRWIADGRLTQERADRQIARLERAITIVAERAEGKKLL